MWQWRLPEINRNRQEKWNRFTGENTCPLPGTWPLRSACPPSSVALEGEDEVKCKYWYCVLVVVVWVPSNVTIASLIMINSSVWLCQRPLDLSLEHCHSTLNTRHRNPSHNTHSSSGPGSPLSGASGQNLCSHHPRPRPHLHWHASRCCTANNLLIPIPDWSLTLSLIFCLITSLCSSCFRYFLCLSFSIYNPLKLTKTIILDITCSKASFLSLSCSRTSSLVRPCSSLVSPATAWWEFSNRKQN